MKSFDAWSRNLTDQLREKEQTQGIKPEDLYTHKDKMRGEGIFSPDYNPKTAKVLWNGEEVDSYTPSGYYISSGLQPNIPVTFNVPSCSLEESVGKVAEREEYNKLQEEARTLPEELEKVPLFVLGHNCTSTETVGSISSTPDIDYNGTPLKKVYCTKEALEETFSSIWAYIDSQYVITDVVGDLVELTKVDKNG